MTVLRVKHPIPPMLMCECNQCPILDDIARLSLISFIRIMC